MLPHPAPARPVAPHDAPHTTHPRFDAALLLDCALDAIVGCAADGSVQVFNAAAEALYGRDRGSVLGAPFDSLLDPARRAADLDVVRLVLDGEAVPHYDTVHRTAAGTPVEVSVAPSPLTGADGAIEGFSLVVRDIGERRLAERELARTRRRLEEHAAELARSNADLEQFAYVASHDLSEPLRTITGMLALLQHEADGKLGEDADHYISRAVAGADRMRKLIDDLLRYGRIGRGGQVREAVDLEAVLAGALEDLGDVVTPESRVVATTPLPGVVADGDALRQVLANLVSNGLKFTRDASPWVEVSARRGEGAWEVTVADGGIGIPPRHAVRVFDVFKRLHTRDAYAGTGIGLAIVQRIVERGGGRVWVEEHEGPGARITFTLPDPAAAEETA